MTQLIFIAVLECVLILIAAAVVAFLISKGKELKLAARKSSQKADLLEKEQGTWKKTQGALETREAWYRQLFNKTEDMVFLYPVTDDELPGQILEVNDSTCRELGYSRDEILKITPLDIEFSESSGPVSGYSRSDMVVLSDDYVKKTHQKISMRGAKKVTARILADGKLHYEQTFKTRTGKKIPVEINARRFDLAGQPVIMCSASDITERKQAENELYESRQRFQDFFSNSPIGIVMYDAERHVVDVNPACLKMLGIPDRQAFAKFDLFDNPYVPADSKTGLNKGETVRYEAAIDFDDVARQSVFVTTRTGDAYFDVLMNNMGPDRDFRQRGYFAVIQDITDRRKAEIELQQNEEQLRQAEKMEAIGSMAGGIAHDFNNILTPIIGYTKMMLRSCSESDKLHKYAAGIQKAAGRAKDLVGQILLFSRKKDEEDETANPIHVIPIAKEVLTLQQTALPDNVEIKRIIKSEKDVVMGNPTKIHQILMNLCTNAGHAMRETDGGVLKMAMMDVVLDAKSRKQHPTLEPGPYFSISVTDTGTGMRKATVERIFEPFFTTKGKGEGTGMGLSVVHGIIKSMKGEITVETEIGKGTTFHILIPSIDKEVAEESAESAQALPTGTEHILLVDDDPDNLEMEQDMLASLGYKLTAADKSLEALAAFKKDPNAFDLVLTDQVMPDMMGADLAKELLAIRPNLPIILCTAYGDTMSPEKAKAIGIREFVTKPFSMDHVAVSIRRELDRKEQ